MTHLLAATRNKNVQRLVRVVCLALCMVPACMHVVFFYTQVVLCHGSMWRIEQVTSCPLLKASRCFARGAFRIYPKDGNVNANESVKISQLQPRNLNLKTKKIVNTNKIRSLINFSYHIELLIEFYKLRILNFLIIMSCYKRFRKRLKGKNW